jgi:hypothetical protein
MSAIGSVVIGWGMPFYVAATVLALFSYLNNRASPKANKAISSWLRSRRYDQSHVSSTLVEVFDKIYTYPLWVGERWRGHSLFPQ